MNINDPSLNQKKNGRLEPHGSFSETLCRGRDALRKSFLDILSVNQCRKNAVLEDISIGSMPRTSYYLLLSISVFIAGFGLLTNSPAVVIGAMLVSPLMTPIFGISLGLVQGNLSLIRWSLMAEFGGVAIAIGGAAALGLLPFAHEVTPEMLARTSPTLLDLLVATLAGMAGCLAMIDERISPVLPGIAIATSLTPPLATSGLCIAFGAFQGAWGAFLLFFANFLAILAVSAALFILAGFVSREEMGSTRQVFKRFTGPAVGLIVVTVLLSHALVNIMRERDAYSAMKEVLEAELALERGAFIQKVISNQRGETTDILAIITAPDVLPPRKVRKIQEKLDQRLKQKTNLIMRFDITKDVSPTGSASGVVGQNLDGDFISTDLHPRVRRLQLAEQVLREMLEEYPNLYLNHLDLVDLPQGSILVATIQTGRRLLALEVASFEEAVQKRLEDPHIRLLVRSNDVTDVTSKGRVLYGRAHFEQLSKEEEAIREDVENRIRAEIMALEYMFATNVDAEKSGDAWRVRAEVVGPRVLTPSEVKKMEANVSQLTEQTLDLHVWCRVELVITTEDCISQEEFTKLMFKERRP